MNLVKKYWAKIVSIIDTPLWLEYFFIFTLILRIPSFFEPYYYGDEMIYLAMGEGIRQGLPLYVELHDNKPPLLYLVAAIANNLFIFKAILAFWNLLTIYGFWKLTKYLFPENNRLQKLSTIIFGLLTTLPLFEGNTVNAELFMIGPIIFAFLIILSKQNNYRGILKSGILISLASLFKIPAAFDMFGIIAFWFIYTNISLKSLFEFIKKTLILLTGFLIPISISFIWYYALGGFKEYLIAAFLQNFGYVSSWRTSNSQEIPFLIKNGPLLIRAGLMFISFFVLWLAKNRLSKQFIFISAWLVATLFAVTLSERPYPHYLVQSLAPISLLLGILLTNKNIEQSLSIIPLTLAFFVPFYYKFWYYPTITYYSNFLKFATNQISKSEYFNTFSPFVNLNYDLAKFIANSLPKDEKIFVWGNDSAGIYALSRHLPPLKYVADYHISEFSNPIEVIKILTISKPKIIVITSNSKELSGLKAFVDQNYYIIHETDSSQIWLYSKK